MRKFIVTYATYSPESVERGDAEDSGLITAGGRHLSTADHPGGESFLPILESNGMKLSEAITLLGYMEDGGSGDSFYETDDRQDYRTGHSERRALHLPRDITPSSEARVHRILKAQRLID